MILRPPLSLVLLAPSFHLSGTITFPSFFSPASPIPPTHLRGKSEREKNTDPSTEALGQRRIGQIHDERGDLTLGAHHRRRRFLCCSCGWDSGTGRGREVGGKRGGGGGGGSAGFRWVGPSGFQSHWARPETRMGQHTSCPMGPIRTEMLASIGPNSKTGQTSLWKTQFSKKKVCGKHRASKGCLGELCSTKISSIP